MVLNLISLFRICSHKIESSIRYYISETTSFKLIFNFYIHETTYVYLNEITQDTKVSLTAYLKCNYIRK